MVCFFSHVNYKLQCHQMMRLPGSNCQWPWLERESSKWEPRGWFGPTERVILCCCYLENSSTFIYIDSKRNRLPSHLSGMAARLQALWAKGWSSYNSPLGVTTACLQTLPRMPDPRKRTLNLHRCFCFRWRRRHTDSFWPKMLKLAANLAAVCSRPRIRTTSGGSRLWAVSENEQKQQGKQ